ncbi:MAG: hypothetical protein HC781_06390 [Leptolyngbyaceae cyanobacterium CSU_1_4]|nr:hypothetical protein [Leptolyngbyaceae cyanobacterium CSU_1_4]
MSEITLLGNGQLVLEIGSATVLPIVNPAQIIEGLTIATLGQTLFTLSTTPARPHLSQLFLNGSKATHSRDYAINGNLLSWVGEIQLQPEDELEIFYS